MISIISRLFRLLSSDIEPYQLSLGIILGMVAGLSPLVTLQTVLVLMLLFILRANLSMFIISYSTISLIAYLADAVIVATGRQVLTLSELNPLFTEMYNNGLWRFLNFNNTAAMGSLLISVVLVIPVFFISQLLVKKYRLTIERRWKNSRLFHFLSRSKIVAKVAAISDRVS